MNAIQEREREDVLGLEDRLAGWLAGAEEGGEVFQVANHYRLAWPTGDKGRSEG
jgi:hypothetical protein